MSYTPTDDQVKFDYIMSTGVMEDIRERGEMFDRWLKQHDEALLQYYGMYADWMEEEPTAQLGTGQTWFCCSMIKNMSMIKTIETVSAPKARTATTTRANVLRFEAIPSKSLAQKKAAVTKIANSPSKIVSIYKHYTAGFKTN